MKTIEVTVCFTVQVVDLVAQDIDDNPGHYCVSLPLSEVRLAGGLHGAAAAQFNGYQTINIEQV